MSGYLDTQGNYYQGDRQNADIEVPARPDAAHVWDGGQWTPSADLVNAGVWEQITDLEKREQLPRMLRDLARRSAEVDAAKIGMTLEQVYALAVAQGDAAPEAAKGWKKFKDFDDSITTLKRQLL